MGDSGYPLPAKVGLEVEVDLARGIEGRVRSSFTTWIVRSLSWLARREVS